MNKPQFHSRALQAALLVGLMSITTGASADPKCAGLPSHAALKTALSAVVAGGGNAGFGNDMWGTVVNRDGQVCAVVFTGADRDSQWPGSRVISAQKANTANSFSLPGAYPNLGIGRALSTGNLYGLTQPGGSLYALEASNPVDTAVAYGDPNHVDGSADRYLTPGEPLVGQFIGGVNVFGGGFALYNVNGQPVGALGVSGDTSCTDHIIGWKTRDALALDNIPGGVGDGATTDNLILADPVTPNTFEHPFCGFLEGPIIQELAVTFPIGPN